MSIYDTLNECQKEAVYTTEGPVLVLAGAGSGKTRALTHRVAYLIEEMGVSPYNIMAITFTNKAAGEMKERVSQIVGMGAEAVWVSTFHSSCVRILRRFADKIGYDTNFTIYDSDDSKTVCKSVCKKLNIDTKQLKERTILSAISSAKNELKTANKFRAETAGDYHMSVIARCYNEYQDTLVKNNAMDFDDLIMNTVELLRQHPDVLNDYQKKFKYIMVDEYQDTNTAQFELIRLLAGGTKNLCVVGDDDQSIYKFRGANIRNILDFEYYYPEARVIRLEQNYRSTQNVLNAANAVIANNEGRKSKTLWTENNKGNLLHLRGFDTAYEEAEFIAEDIARKSKKDNLMLGDCAVLYRTNAQSRLIEEKFVFEGIPYKVVGGVNFYSRREIKDILAYLKTIDNGRDDICVKRIINVPKRGIGASTISKVEAFADEEDICFLEAVDRCESIPGIGKAKEKLLSFSRLIAIYRSRQDMLTLSEQIRDVLEGCEYIQNMDAESEEDAQNRIDNIEEFINKAKAYEQEHEGANLTDFLEEVALVADIDEVEGNIPKALLMTLHSAKGLEFKNVYLAGMEDGLFPSYMTIVADDPKEIEEERRLAYVGITRAKEELTLTYARSRMQNGQMQYNAVSRFVKEIPKELLDNRPYNEGHHKDEHEDFPAIKDNSYKKPVAYLRENNSIYSSKKAGFSSNQTIKKNEFANITGNAQKGLASLNIPGISKGMPLNNDSSLKGEKGNAALVAKPDYDIGSRVKHFKYGEGTVVDLEPGNRDYKVTVDFDEAGNKIMYAAFAKLQSIE